MVMSENERCLLFRGFYFLLLLFLLRPRFLALAEFLLGTGRDIERLPAVVRPAGHAHMVRSHGLFTFEAGRDCRRDEGKMACARALFGPRPLF